MGVKSGLGDCLAQSKNKIKKLDKNVKTRNYLFYFLAILYKLVFSLVRQDFLLVNPENTVNRGWWGQHYYLW